MPVWQLQLCVLSWEFNFLELVTVVHLASNRFLEGGDTAKKKKERGKNPTSKIRESETFISA